MNNNKEHKKNIIMNNLSKIFSVLLLSIIMSGVFIPTIASAASINEYTAIPLIDATGDKIVYETIVATDGDDSMIDGNGYDYEATGQNFNTAPGVPVGCEIDNFSACQYENDDEAIYTDEEYMMNSWNGTDTTSAVDARVGASPEEGELATEKVNILTDELNELIDYITHGGVPVSDIDSFLSASLELSDAIYNGSKNPSGVYDTNVMGFTPEHHYFKITPATPSDAQERKESLPQNLFYSNNPEDYKEQFVTVTLCEEPDPGSETDSTPCESSTGSQTFLWKIPKGYAPGGDLNATISSKLIESGTVQENECPGGVCDMDTLAKQGIYDEYYMQSIIVNAAYAYTNPVIVKDVTEKSNVSVTDDGSSNIDEPLKDIWANIQYQIQLRIQGIPAPDEFMNPYGMFSTWFFGVVPQSLSSLFIVSLLISVIAAIIMLGYSTILRILNVKSLDNDNNNIYAELSEILKGLGMYVFGVLIMYIILFACIMIADLMYEMVWAIFGGTPEGPSEALIINPANMVEGFVQSSPVAMAFAAAAGAWFLLILYQKFQIMLMMIFMPITCLEFTHSKSMEVVFQRLPNILSVVILKSAGFLISYVILILLQAQDISVTPVVAGFIFALAVFTPSVITKLLGIRDTLLPDGLFQANTAQKYSGTAKDAYDSLKNTAKDASKGSNGGSKGGGGGMSPGINPNAQDNINSVLSQSQLDKNKTETPSGESLTTDAKTNDIMPVNSDSVGGKVNPDSKLKSIMNKGKDVASAGMAGANLAAVTAGNIMNVATSPTSLLAANENKGSFQNAKDDFMAKAGKVSPAVDSAMQATLDNKTKKNVTMPNNSSTDNGYIGDKIGVTGTDNNGNITTGVFQEYAGMGGYAENYGDDGIYVNPDDGNVSVNTDNPQLANQALMDMGMSEENAQSFNEVMMNPESTLQEKADIIKSTNAESLGFSLNEENGTVSSNAHIGGIDKPSYNSDGRMSFDNGVAKDVENHDKTKTESSFVSQYTANKNNFTSEYANGTKTVYRQTNSDKSGNPIQINNLGNTNAGKASEKQLEIQRIKESRKK